MKIVIGDMEVVASRICVTVVGETEEKTKDRTCSLMASAFDNESTCCESLGPIFLRPDNKYERDVILTDFNP
jgi:hypothetical protein